MSIEELIRSIKNDQTRAEAEIQIGQILFEATAYKVGTVIQIDLKEM